MAYYVLGQDHQLSKNPINNHLLSQGGLQEHALSFKISFADSRIYSGPKAPLSRA